MNNNFRHSDISGIIIKAFYSVYNTLGHGFLEKVYENALLIEMRKSGLDCKAQMPIKVHYDNYEVGHYLADIVVNDCIIIDVKAAEALCDEHEAQLTNYLRATNIEVGLLLNFGKTAEVKRKVFSAEFKKHNIS